MSDDLAIIFAHRKPADYLVYAAAQARAFNPEAKIHALLDYEDPLVARYATVGNIFDYLDDVREFERDWVNFSDLGYHYECFCSQRWLIIRNYALAHGLRRFIYLDSDVMCYANLARDLAAFRSAPVSYAGGSAHTLLVEDFDRYQDFCTFLLTRYRSPEKVAAMHEQYRKHKERTRSGGIQDMAHWSAFERESGLKFGNLALADNGVVTSTHSKTFDKALGRAVPVDFTWKDGQAYGRDRYSNTDVRFSTVHYQGSFKYLIPKNFTGSPAEAKRLKGELRVRSILSVLQARTGKFYEAITSPFSASETFQTLKPLSHRNRHLTFSS